MARYNSTIHHEDSLNKKFERHVNTKSYISGRQDSFKAVAMAVANAIHLFPYSFRSTKLIKNLKQPLIIRLFVEALYNLESSDVRDWETTNIPFYPWIHHILLSGI